MSAIGQASGGGPPQDRDQLLAQAGEVKTRIYAMVRTILDDLEAVAPWEGLYYPPTDPQEFLSMEIALVAMIEDIPARVGTLTQALSAEESDEAILDLIGNAEFYFHGIGVSVASELEKLRAKLETFKTSPHELSPVERTFTCEISADLKGKYTSSIMGAAASLVAEGLWNGVEIEPILFPEKAKEFDRNEKLVTRLSRVTETIQGFLEQVPLAELVASWQQRRRADQYALAPLYSLLGDLGKLMQVSSRRALYSGDYHQIQRREVLLSSRINELTSLHSMTWKTADAEGTGDDVYVVMVEKAVELAAILDVEILKKIIGDGAVKDLFLVVTLEKEAGAETQGDAQGAARRERIPEEHHSLISLLYDEDLKTFLELLLGSVLKRASLTVNRAPAPAPAESVAPPPAMPEVGIAEVGVAEVGVAEVGVTEVGVTEVGPAGFDLEPPELLSTSSAVDSEDPTVVGTAASVMPPEFGFDLPSLAPDAPQEPALDVTLPASQALPLPANASPQADAFPPPADAFPPPADAFPPSDVFPPPADAFPPSDAFPPPTDSWLSSDAPASSEVLPAIDTPDVLGSSGGPSNGDAGRLDALNSLLGVLTPLLSRTSSNRKSFELVRRLLNQNRAIPAGLLQSMRPYLYEVMNELVPQLRDDTRLGDVYSDYGTTLSGHCQMLCDPTLSPESGLTEVPAVMEQVLDLLNRLAITARSSVEQLA